MIRFDKRIWVLWAMWLLILPLKWLIAALASIVIHELFHIAAICLVGGTIRGIHIVSMGVLIEADGIRGIREIICALAGPAGSFLLVYFIRIFPMLGLCGLVHGLFNLLPVYPLDGGRALKTGLECIMSDSGEKVYLLIENGFLFAFVCGSIYICVQYRLGIIPILFCIFMIVSALLRKGLEKEGKSGYNSATI